MYTGVEYLAPLWDVTCSNCIIHVGVKSLRCTHAHILHACILVQHNERKPKDKRRPGNKVIPLSLVRTTISTTFWHFITSQQKPIMCVVEPLLFKPKNVNFVCFYGMPRWVCMCQTGLTCIIHCYSNSSSVCSINYRDWTSNPLPQQGCEYFTATYKLPFIKCSLCHHNNLQQQLLPPTAAEQCALTCTCLLYGIRN